MTPTPEQIAAKKKQLEYCKTKWDEHNAEIARSEAILKQRHEANLKTVEEGFQRAFGGRVNIEGVFPPTDPKRLPPVNHGVVDLAEKTYYPGKMPPEFKPSQEPMAIIQMTEGLEEELAKQSKILGMTQLIAIIALGVAVIALLT